ncbi:MAG: hypothetical protein RLZZ628_1785 [Bacteroidota bacterium]|jgi:hypothetical protein
MSKLSLNNISKPQEAEAVQTMDLDKEISRGKKEVEEDLNYGNVRKFPIEVFPKFFKDMVLESHRVKKFPIDYFASSLLFVCGATLGNSYKLRIQDNYYEKGLLWLCLMGRPNTMKSPPLEWVMQHLWDKHEAEQEKYDNLLAMGATNIKMKEILMKDYTPEALVMAHSNNKKGVIIHSDEITKWIGNFHRYSTGGNESDNWLETWNYKPYSISRIGKKLFIPNTFLPVIGTSQYQKFKKTVMSNGLFTDGFLERFLFVAPNGLIKEMRTAEQMNPELYNQYKEQLERLDDFAAKYDNKVACLNETNHKIILDWINENNQLCNQANEKMSSMLGKFDMHIYRLAVCIQGMEYAAGLISESDMSNITKSAAEAAVKLADYFRECNMKLMNYFTNSQQVLFELPKDVQIWYSALPREEFPRSLAIEMAARFTTKNKLSGLSERQVYRYMSEEHKPKLFRFVKKEGMISYYRKTF